MRYGFQVEYQKQKRRVIDNYRGFQTMDSGDHPVIQQGIKAAELLNDVSETTRFWNRTFALIYEIITYHEFQ